MQWRVLNERQRHHKALFEVLPRQFELHHVRSGGLLMPHGGFHGGGHGRRGRGFRGGGGWGWDGPWYEDAIDVEAIDVPDPDVDPNDAIATGRGGGGGSAHVKHAQARQMQSAEDDAPLDAGTSPAPGATAAVQGGAFDRLAHIIAVHEGFWGGVAQRNPDSELMRWWLTQRWDPYYAHWTELVTQHGLSDDDIDVLSEELRVLNGLRGEAEAHRVPLPMEFRRGTAITGLTIGFPRPFAPEAERQTGDDDVHAEIDRETDARFWAETGYKPGQKLDAHNRDDRHMINAWLRIRYEVAQEYAAEHADRVAGAINRGRMSKNTLIQCGAVLAPEHTRELKVSFGLDGNGTLHGVIVLDGQRHEGSIDLEPLLTDIHRKLHVDGGMPMPADNPLRAYPMMGAEWEQIVGDYHAIIGAEADAQTATTIRAAGDLLVGKLIAEHNREKISGWWDNLKKKVKHVAHDVAHEVTHPNELAKDVSHYALHPADAIRKVAQGLGAGAGLANVLSYAADPLQDLTENPQVQNMVATMYGGPAGAAALKAAQSLDSGNGIAGTLQALAPQIAGAASQAAGAAMGPQAAALTTAVVNAATGTGSAQQVAQTALDAAQTAAQSDPAVQQALDTAHQAVAHATAAYHIAQTVSNAAQGDTNAQQQVAQLAASASDGDPAAQTAAAVAQDITNVASTNAVTSGVADPRSVAAVAAQGAACRYVGVVIPNDGNPMQVKCFASSDDADDWFGGWLSQAPHAVEYIAYYDKSDSSFPGPLNEQLSKRAHETSARVGAGWVLPFLAGGALGFGVGVSPLIALRKAAQFARERGAVDAPSAQLFQAAQQAGIPVRSPVMSGDANPMQSVLDAIATPNPLQGLPELDQVMSAVRDAHPDMKLTPDQQKQLESAIQSAVDGAINAVAPQAPVAVKGMIPAILATLGLGAGLGFGAGAGHAAWNRIAR
jgi:hypothetical protein